MTVRSHIDALRKTLPPGVTLVAVSKFHPAETVRQAYDAGQRIFGESRVQELIAKKDLLPDDIEWHFIGRLQRNKVRQIAPFISLIHSIDSEQLLLEIEKQAAACNRTIPGLLQIHIAREKSKAGFPPDACRRFLAEGKWKASPHVQIAGVMGMATLTDDENRIRQEFRLLKSLFDELKTAYFPNDPAFREISAGMTDDYRIAIQEGSSVIRTGTLIFGER